MKSDARDEHEIRDLHGLHGQAGARTALHHQARHDRPPQEGGSQPQQARSKAEGSESGRRDSRSLNRSLMDWATFAAGLLGLAGGAAGEWLRHGLSRRDIRKAVAAEIDPILTDLNFFILRAMEPNAPSSNELVTQFFGQPYTLKAFEYYWQDQRDRLLRLPEWPRLQKWSDSLNRIAEEPDDALFRVVMLFESLRVAPLTNCLSRDSRKFVERVSNRPEVAEYRLNILKQRAGLL